MNQAIHNVDLLQWLMGDVESVQAMTATLAHERIEVEDTAVAVLRFKNGALGVIEAATGAYPGLLKRTEIHGDGGSARVEQDDVTLWTFRDERPGDAEMLTPPWPARPPAARATPAAISHAGHRDQLADFLRAIDDGPARPASTAARGGRPSRSSGPSTGRPGSRARSASRWRTTSPRARLKSDDPLGVTPRRPGRRRRLPDHLGEEGGGDPDPGEVVEEARAVGDLGRRLFQRPAGLDDRLGGPGHAGRPERGEVGRSAGSGSRIRASSIASRARRPIAWIDRRLMGPVGPALVVGVLDQEVAVAEDLVDRGDQVVPEEPTRRLDRPRPGARSISHGWAPVGLAEDRLDLGEEPGEVDGLDVVVVAAGLDGPLAVAGHRVRGQGDDRDGRGGRVGLEPAGRLPAVEPGQAQVHQDQVEPTRPRRVHALGPSTAIATSNPWRASRRESMSRFISLSSTSKIRGMAASSLGSGVEAA